MPLEPEFLRRHYASLSDEALLATNRTDLVDIARTIFDEEVRARDLSPKRAARKTPGPPTLPHPDLEADHEPPDAADWLEEAAEVYSVVVRPGSDEASNALGLIEAAGIPCQMDQCEIPEETGTQPYGTHRWRILVPGKLYLQAASVLERDISNQEFEEIWKAHLETLSDEELRATNPEDVFCGLYDRIERVNRVYDEEIERRR